MQTATIEPLAAATAPSAAPPLTKRVLIVEDDRMLARICWKKLSLAGYSADVAPDGVRGLAMVRQEKPDLIVLDLMLPEMNGIEVLKHLRQDPATHDLPVVVFTNVFLGDWVDQARRAGATRILSKTHDSPDKLIKEIVSLIGQSAPPLIKADGEPKTRSTLEAPPEDPRQTYLRYAAGNADELHRLLDAFLLRGSGDLSRVVELHQKVRTVGNHATSAGFPLTAHVAMALEAHLKELNDRPQAITPSARQTVTDGVRCLEALLPLVEQPAECNFSQVNVLAVDDDAVSLRLITHALGRARLWAKCVDQPTVALQLLTASRFDLILLDVEMPVMTGPQLCEKIRRLPTNTHTPVIFVTGVKEFERRQDAIAQGGDDLIAKPFLCAELALKALTRLITARA